MRRSNVLGFPLQIVFPALPNVSKGAITLA
jgi:hypothetical protein